VDGPDAHDPTVANPDTSETVMIRPTEPRDTTALLDLARETGVFKPLEIVALGEVLDDYHAKEHGLGHRAITDEREGRPVGFAYYAPASMTDRAWYLYWIAVEKQVQARGLGSALLEAAEEDIRGRGGRLFLIETSSLPHYEPTRRFYLRHGYEQASVLHDFYADGDDLVVFRKRLLPPGSRP
jgi:ribosomal protein S18 acetylase RimI-like enzyme